MLLLTIDTLPEGVEIEQFYGLIQITMPIEISQKNLLRRITEGNEDNGQQKAIDALAQQASSLGANLVYGIKQSTTIGQFNNGTYLYITYIGTAALVKE